LHVGVEVHFHSPQGRDSKVLSQRTWLSTNMAEQSIGSSLRYAAP
jgi:hypothetical protein